MAAWDCPSCGRRFARQGQGHECTPAISLAAYFATGHAREREVFDAVMAALDDADIRPVHVEPVSVGIFLKRAQSFAQLRPMQRWVALSFSLGRKVDHALITRKVVPYSGRYHHVVNLRDADDVDDDIAAWLAEAYFEAPD